MAQLPIGIDLGTTNSLIAVFEDGKPRLLNNSLEEVMTPSVVARRDDGLLVGQAAWDLAATDPKAAAASFKRKMGTDVEIPLGNMKLTAPELSAIVLKKLKADAEEALGHPVTDVVVSVPAYFNQVQRSATQTSCKLAGLNPLHLINEPTAAALAYGVHDKEGESEFMVFDLGGGTFDVTVLEHFDGVMEVKASSGDAFLGGEDFTKVIKDLFLEKMGVAEKKLSSEDYAKVSYYAEQAKRELSKDNPCEFKFQVKGTDYNLQLTPEEFEAAAGTLIKRLKLPIHRCLYDNEGNERPLDKVILVGGSSRMPMARRVAARELGLFPDATINPDHAVALGAAVQAALIAEDKALEDVVMTDVSPFSVGTSISSTGVGKRRISDVFDPIIERNTPLPASRVQRYWTTASRQKRIYIELFQGESAKASENVQLGEFEVPIPSNKAGEESVDVRVTYDVSGLIEVVGTSTSTGATNRMLIETGSKPMDDKQIEQKLTSLAALKIHPIDVEANIAVLERMKRLFEMTTGDDRDDIKGMMVDFESLLERQDPRLIEEERERLNKYLDMIDNFYVS